MSKFAALLAATALTACASAPAKPEVPLTPYVCNGAPTNLLADYYSAKKPRVILTIGTEKTTLYPAPSANGTRYTTGVTNPNEVLQRSDKPGNFVWWVKGSDAMLYEVAKRADGTTYEKQLANCTSNPQPLQLAPETLPVPNPDRGLNLPGTIPGTVPSQPQSATPKPTTV